MRDLITIGASGIIGFLITYFTLVMPVNRDKQELTQLLDSTIYDFEQYQAETGEIIQTQGQNIASLENAIAAGIIAKEELEKHNISQAEQIVRLKAEVTRLRMEATFPKPPVIIEKPSNDTITDEFMRIPQEFTFKDEWMQFDGVVHREGVTLKDFNLKTETSIYTGYQKRGFFRRAEPVVIVEYTNPYMRGVAMENITIREEPPWYNRPNFYRLQGAAAMYLIFRLVN